MIVFHPVYGILEFLLPKTSEADADDVHSGILRVLVDSEYRIRTDKTARVVATDTPVVTEISGTVIV